MGNHVTFSVLESQKQGTVTYTSGTPAIHLEGPGDTEEQSDQLSGIGKN